jgi:hypothetical protein
LEAWVTELFAPGHRVRLPKGPGGWLTPLWQLVTLGVGSTENLDNLLPLATVRQGTSLESSKAYRTDTTESDGSCSLGMVKHVVSRTRPRGNRGSGAVHPRDEPRVPGELSKGEGGTCVNHSRARLT